MFLVEGVLFCSCSGDRVFIMYKYLRHVLLIILGPVSYLAQKA